MRPKSGGLSENYRKLQPTISGAVSLLAITPGARQRASRALDPQWDIAAYSQMEALVGSVSVSGSSMPTAWEVVEHDHDVISLALGVFAGRDLSRALKPIGLSSDDRNFYNDAVACIVVGLRVIQDRPVD